MILTPLDPEALPRLLDIFDAGLAGAPLARQVFRRIAATRALCPGFSTDLHAGRAKAIALARALGIETLDEEPKRAFSWDGRVIRTRSETSVVFHEIAHWQLAGARRDVVDFGLGAGPETGRVDEANAVACADAATREHEENLASLLGILWEVEHGEPALLAFAEQNWLELAERAHTQAHFVRCLEELIARGLVDADGRPNLTSSRSG
jgi:hypothetical protein